MRSHHELTGRVASHISKATGTAAEVSSLTPLLGGACQDLFRVQFATNGEARTAVLRSDAVTSLPTSLRRRDEYDVIRAAVTAGVATPKVYWPAEDLVRDGASSYFMDWAEGVTIARTLLTSPDLAQARQRLPQQLATTLAALHLVDPADHPALRAQAADAESALTLGASEACLLHHRRAIDGLPTARPVLELTLRWLQDNRPAPVPLRLCHGDFRTGNFVVNETGLVGVLDWEFAHWGDPMDDVGWMCVRDWRFGQLALAAGGLCDRATFYAAYEAATGRAIEHERVHYWEVMGNLRWAIGAIYQGERYLSGAESDLELIAIGHRVRQLEYELLRLLETGI